MSWSSSAGRVTGLRRVPVHQCARLVHCPRSAVRLDQQHCLRRAQVSGTRNLHALNSRHTMAAPSSGTASLPADQQQAPRRSLVTTGGLDKIVKLDMFRSVSAEEVSRLWIAHHKDKKLLAAVIPGKTFEKLSERAKNAPLFVFPVPKGAGYESWFWAQQDNHALITTVEEYKRLGASAAPHLHVTFYDELQEDKDLVLMRSEEVDTRFLSVQEAQYLVNAWQLFVLDDDRYKLMQDFNHNPGDFEFDKVVQLMDSVPSLPDECNTQ